MKFFIWDFENEYVVVDLDKNIKISGGPIDLDNPELGIWINDIFVDVSRLSFGSSESSPKKRTCQK